MKPEYSGVVWPSPEMYYFQVKLVFTSTNASESGLEHLLNLIIFLIEILVLVIIPGLNLIWLLVEIYTRENRDMNEIILRKSENLCRQRSPKNLCGQRSPKNRYVLCYMLIIKKVGVA